MDTIPADISRNIYKMAIKAKNDHNEQQIKTTIWNVLHFILSSTVLQTEIPLFEGSLKQLYVTVFNVDKIMQPSGLVTTRMVFFVDYDEFEVTYNDYGDDADVCLHVVNKHGHYKDIVAEAFWECFYKGTVY
jgi:hypothetical protein